MGRIRDKLWEAESNLPDSVKKYTDKAVRMGARVAKRLQPFREDTERRGKAWVERHFSLTKKKHSLGLGKKRRR